MLRTLSRPGVKHVLSTPSLRARASATDVMLPAHTRSLVSTVLLTADGYESKQVVELRAMLRQRGLTTTGRKAELVQRLKQNDMKRAGSTLAVAAPGTPKAPRKPRGKRGADAAAAAAESNPSVSLEAGTVVSANADSDGGIGASSPKEAAPSSGNAPGRPQDLASKTENTFHVMLPFEEEPKPEPQYIPSIRMFEEPTHDFSDSFKPDWHVAHVPRVHAMGHQPDMSHNASISLSERENPPAPRKNALLQMAEDVLSTNVHRSLSERWSSLQASTQGTLSNLVSDYASALPVDQSVRLSPSHGRPSTRRPLNAQERTGAYVLGGIVLTGFALGGLGVAKERPQETPAAPVYQPPHYARGGGVVGAGQRKV
ncbi:hypothetical protein MEQU1_002864 [Malassezia equina]|uniref:SAP domain-containing protein n=1 Tax=Malassezia equina TaxID=1381935 RepID=A0AAF0EL62_9BASI|nr:hypothetical protein MEQU1_002864 [Malassezia equina]